MVGNMGGGEVPEWWECDAYTVAKDIAFCESMYGGPDDDHAPKQRKLTPSDVFKILDDLVRVRGHR